MATLQPENSRKIVKKDDGYHVYSEDGKKHLGGPYKTEEEAKKRLEQIEYFKHKGGKSMIYGPERRVFAAFEAELRVKSRENGSKVIEGYAAKFGKMSQILGEGKRQFVETIHRNAFENCISRCDVRCLRNHEPDLILGRTKSGTMKLSTDDVGLRFEVDLPDTQTGRDTAKDIERGDLDGCSFSFTTEEDGDEWDDATNPPTRTLTKVRDLFDVGPVTYPAYLDTEVKCRSLDRFHESRELAQREQLLQVQRIRILKLRLGLSIT
jgi:Escherichia/Staphylococcus phage prohead protease